MDAMPHRDTASILRDTLMVKLSDLRSSFVRLQLALAAAFTARAVLAAGLSAATMLTTTFTTRLALLASATNLGVRYPSGERRLRRRQADH